MHSPLLRLLQLVQLVAVNILARNAGGTATNSSTVERWATEPVTTRSRTKHLRKTRLFIEEVCLPLLRKRLRELQQL